MTRGGPRVVLPRLRTWRTRFPRCASLRTPPLRAVHLHRAIRSPSGWIVRAPCRRRAEAAFDVLLTPARSARSPWVASGDIDATIAEVTAAIAASPAAAAALVGVLRLGARLAFDEALWLESLAYSTLLTGETFRLWRCKTPLRGAAPVGEPVRLERNADALLVQLDDPTSRNALSPAMRDALLEALLLAEVDPTIGRVIITGKGPVFSSGGHLDDFGTSRDLAEAHRTRFDRSVVAMINRLADRTLVRVHGAAVGSGLEFAAAAGRLEARADTVFRLPEVAMGLIPGAGGTVSVSRRIGRHRTAFMALTGRGVDVETALDWGLIDAVVRAS